MSTFVIFILLALVVILVVRKAGPRQVDKGNPTRGNKLPRALSFGATRSLPVDLKINYTDGKGISSRRTISLKTYAHNGQDGDLHAFCHHANAFRTFHFSRVDKAIDMESGEIIASLPEWLDEKFKIMQSSV